MIFLYVISLLSRDPGAPGRTTDALDDAGRRAARQVANRHDPAAVALDRQALRKGVGVVVAALDVDVRADRLEQPDRRVVLEYGHVLDAADGRDDRGAILRRADRPVRAFQLAHGLVGVDPDDQHVTEGCGLLKAFDVAAVQHVEASVGEHNPVACAAMPGEAAGQEVNGPDRIESPFFEPHVSPTTLASLSAARYPAAGPVNRPAPVPPWVRPVSRPRAPLLVVSSFRREKRWRGDCPGNGSVR